MRHIADTKLYTLIDGLFDDIIAVENNLAFQGLYYAHYAFEGGAFAHAVSADKSDYLAFFHLKAEIFYHTALAVIRVNIFDTEHFYSPPLPKYTA